MNPHLIRYECDHENPDNLFFVDLSDRFPRRIRAKPELVQIMEILLEEPDLRSTLNRVTKELRIALDPQELREMVAALLEIKLLVPTESTKSSLLSSPTA